MLEDFGWSDDAVDPRPLRRLGVVSGSVLLAAAVLLVHEHHRGARGLSGGGLFVVWLVVVVAALLFVGAVGGFVARRAAARYRRLDPEEAHDRQVVQTLLRRGSGVPPELGEVTQRVVDDTHGRRWSPVLWMPIGVYWIGSAFIDVGWERWFHLGAGLLYLVAAIWRLVDRRRVLRAAARLGVRPLRKERLR